MATPRRNALWAAAAALNGVAGVAAARCAGGACTRCFACAVPAAGVVVLALLGARQQDPAERTTPAARPGPGG